jgi:hypothetical protein
MMRPSILATQTKVKPMAEETETETGATPYTRALNKVKAILASAPNDAVKDAAGKLTNSLVALSSKDRSTLETGLSRKRQSSFAVGDKVNVKAEFSDLYKPKGPYTVTEVLTVGGDENKRGGRSFVKAKHANGNTLPLPASCFEPA